jgi:hypothetical protein
MNQTNNATSLANMEVKVGNMTKSNKTSSDLDGDSKLGIGKSTKLATEAPK